MAKQKGKQELVALAGTLTVGIQKHLANGQLTFAGGTFTAAEIESANRQPHGAINGDFRHPHGSTQSPG